MVTASPHLSVIWEAQAGSAGIHTAPLLQGPDTILDMGPALA